MLDPRDRAELTRLIQARIDALDTKAKHDSARGPTNRDLKQFASLTGGIFELACLAKALGLAIKPVGLNSLENFPDIYTEIDGELPYIRRT